MDTFWIGASLRQDDRMDRMNPFWIFDLPFGVLCLLSWRERDQGRLGLAQFASELVRGEFDFAEDFTNEGAGEVSASMFGESRCSAVGMTVEDVATSLTYGLEAEVEEDFFHPLETNNRQTRHTATSIC